MAGELVELEAGPSVTVSPNTSFQLTFDRFLLPTSAIRQAVCIQVGTDAVTTLDDCVAPVTLAPSYDPVKREVVYRVSAGIPESDDGLQPGSVHRLSLIQPIEDDPESTGFRAFDGALIEDPPSFQFDVGDTPLDPPPDPAPTEVASTFCDAPYPILTENCAFTGGCHVNTQDSTQAPMNLQFSVFGLAGPAPTADVLLRTAIGHVAHGTMTGEHAQLPDTAPLRFGRAMPIVDAQGAAGNSYLLYKLLVADSDEDQPFASAAEVQRLRNGFVVGNPMPLYNALGGQRAAMSLKELSALSFWIQQGAPVQDSCE